MKFHPKRVVPNEQFLSTYEALPRLERRRQRDFGSERDVISLRTQFEEQAAALQRPHPTGRELFGWQRLIYETLPEGRFTTSDVHGYEAELGLYCPENRNVRAKIRQVLQQLRELGLFEHIDRGTWIKRRVDEARP